MESYLMDLIEGGSDIEDRAFQARVVESAEKMFSDVIKHTSNSGAIAYYFRMDPSISSSTTGLFYSKIEGSEEFFSFEPTDLSIYDRDDTEHVGWFWQPYDAGEPIWMDPYYNQNNGILMISYVIPMYFNDRFIGVVGMDFDYKVLTNLVHKIEIYENGFAHLESDGVVICSDVLHDSDHASDAKSNEYLHVSGDLVNGMTLVLSASYRDIRQTRDEITFKILFTALVLFALFTVVAIFIVRKIVDPLKRLTDAAAKLSGGDYGVDIVSSNTREINLLSNAFDNMTKRLSEREELLRHSANFDSLTGIRNSTAYASWVNEFNKKTENGQIDFGVVVLDLNNLKKTNDEYGHRVGDELIVASAEIICAIFKKSPVFRIGGDEFCVILQNADLQNCDTLFEQFKTICSSTIVDENTKIPVSIALGFARFDSERDTCFKDVFKRADEAMYDNKRKSKPE